MNWKHVRLIFVREVRDQLRDRRTMFMIAVLPLLLYPLLGLSFFQASQFVREHPTQVLVLGADDLQADEQLPPLFDDGRFAEYLFDGDLARARLLEIEFVAPEEPPTSLPLAERARAWVQLGEYEVVVAFPDDFAAQMRQYREMLSDLRSGAARERPEAVDSAAKIPGPQVFHNSARETSQIAFLRVSRVLRHWTAAIGRTNLEQSGVPESAADPVDVAEVDVADAAHRDAAIWSKIFPVLILLWALTGAFYPAVDLCAGEKERGTLETLLCSPANRLDIVWGKLLTVMLFSAATAVLNLVSVSITGFLVLQEIDGFGAPPALTPVWLLLALIPVSALFGALCLALAAMARSSKEGQYYLIPLILITMPLVVLPMAPSVELTLGNSLIPLTGMVLLLRTLIEGAYLQALPFILPVVFVSLGCCLLAIRWAVDQFNTESVLFRESERLDLALWFRHLLRDRQNTPSVAEALFCCVVILMIRVFLGLMLSEPASFRDVMVLALTTQLVVIATPALLMTVMLTRSPRDTLLLGRGALWSLPAMVVLAFALHPVTVAFRSLVMELYPLSEEVVAQLSHFSVLGGEEMSIGKIAALLITLAVIPGICEELAFRGFVLSGLRRLGHKWQAILLCSFFFAVTHAIFQQSIVAFALGAVLGYIAVQTGSILPCIVYHVMHNALGLATAWLTPERTQGHPLWDWLIAHSTEAGVSYQWPVVALGAAVALAILMWLSGKPHPLTREESLQDAIDHSARRSAPG